MLFISQNELSLYEIMLNSNFFQTGPSAKGRGLF